MKKILIDRNRDEHVDIVVKSQNGEFAYKIHPDFQKIPDFVDQTVSMPHGCTDDEGNLYVTSRDKNHPIIKLDSDGNYIKDFGAGLFTFTHMISVTPEGTLLCPDCATHVVRELTLDGELIRDLGNYGVPSDSGYEPGAWRRLRREGRGIPSDIGFDSHWSNYVEWNSITRMAPPFNKPTCAKINSKGEIFVSDGYANVAVHRFSKDGELLKSWGGKGKAPGKFFLPHSLAIDKYDRIWVADREGNSLQIFDDQGNVLAYADENMVQPSDIWAEGDYVYVGERGGNISIFDLDFNVVGTLGFFNWSIVTHGMCVNKKGDIFVFPSNSNPDHWVIKLERI